MKNCSKYLKGLCSQINPQPESEFYKLERGKGGLTPACKTCTNLQNKNWHKSNAGWSRNYKKEWELAHPEAALLSKRKSHMKDPRKRILKNAKMRALKKNILFSLVLDDIVIPKICPYLGITIVLDNRKLNDNSPSLDRIDPKVGYIKDNIEIISNRANMIKNCGTAEEHLKIAKRMFKITTK